MENKIGYHIKEIQKGSLGEVSKIQEEFQEFLDAHEQSCVVMEFVELSDLLGAIEAYLLNYNLKLEDLIIMKNITKRAFLNGRR